MGANISTCCTDTTTSTARRVGGGSSSSSGSDSEEHSSTDTDGSGRTTLDNNNNAQQAVHHHHLSNRTQKHTSGRHHTTAAAGSVGATRHPQQHNSVSTGSDAANPSIAFPTLVLEQQTQSVETTHHHHHNATTSSERIPQQQQRSLHTAARNPLVAPVTSSTTPLPSPSDYLFAYDAASEEDVISQRRGAMIGMVDMISGAPTEFEDAFSPRDTTAPLSHGILPAGHSVGDRSSDNNASSSFHHQQQQSSLPRQQQFGPSVFHVAGNGGVPAAHLAAEKTVARVALPSSHSNITTGHHVVKDRTEGSVGPSNDSHLVMANRNEGSISSNLLSGALENEPSGEPPTVFAQQQSRTSQVAANTQQTSAGTIVSSSTTVPGGTDDDLILSPTSQASTTRGASTLAQLQANGAVDEEQLHVLSPPVVVAEQTIMVVKRHSAPIVLTTTAIHSHDGGEGQGQHTNPLSPGVVPPPLPQHLPLTSFDSLRTPRGTAAMEEPSEQAVPQLFVEVADGGQWGGDRNSAPALRHPSTASGSRRSASLYQVRQQRQQQSTGSDGGGGSGGGGWSSRDSSPLSSVSSVSSLGSGSAAGGDGERRRRRGGSPRRSSVASASRNVSAGQIRRASRPQRSPNPHGEVETDLPHEGAHSIGSGPSAAEILPTTSANILREEVERCIGDDRALLTILSQGSLQKLTPTGNAANTAQQEGQVQASHRQQSSIFASDGCYQQAIMAAAPTAAQIANNNSSTNISSGSATHRSSGSAADAINNSSLGVQGLAPYVYNSSMDGGQASAGGGAEDPYRRQSSLQASSIASVGGLVAAPSGANASLFSSEGGASLQTPGGYLHHSRLLSGNASGSVGGRSPGGALGASSNSNSQHPLLGGISTSFQSGGSLGGGGAASPSYASDPQLFPSSGAPTTGRASSWGFGASGMESTSGYAVGGALEASGQSGPLLRLHWTNSLLMRMAQGGDGTSSLAASGQATPVACSS